MKNIQGKEEDLKLFNKEGDLVYEFCKHSGGYSYESTCDSNGKVLTYKDSDGFTFECTYDSNGNELTCKNSIGFWSERTYDSDGNELTYKNSNGVTRGF